jgi:hypothetical protein
VTRLAAIALLALLSACGVNGLSFVADERVDITRPGDRDEIRLPVTVEWTVKDFAVGAGEGSFGVFLDREPQRPGKTLAWLFRGEDTCRGASGNELCATADFLASRRVFETTETSLTFEQVPQLSGNERRRQFHEVTVVLLDDDGRRVGEGAWSVQFELRRER